MRATSAEQMRAHRARHRRRLRCIMLEVREVEVDVLIAKGLLAAADRDDAMAISAALGRFLDATLGPTP